MFLRKILYLRDINRSQYWAHNRIREMQEKKLKILIRKTYGQSSIYSKKMKQANVRPIDIQSLDDIPLLPITKKNDYLQDEDSEKKCISGKYICKKTSGSTGEPLSIVFNKSKWDLSQVYLARALFAAGARLTDKISFFWYEIPKDKGFFQKLGIFKKQDILYTEDENVQLQKLIQYLPDIICSLPSVLSVLADLIKKKGITEIRPRIILCFGELLTESTKKNIQEAFNARIYNQYASTEFNWIAFECEKGSMHINAESFLIESQKNDNKLLITDLDNTVMPIIRYQIGDIGKLSHKKCDCGRNLPILEHLEGRLDDFLYLPNKRVISPRTIGGAFEEFSNIVKYKVLQKREDLIEVYIIPKNNLDIFQIKKRIGDIVGNDVSVIIKKTDKISMHRGKDRMIESLVKK